MAASVSPESVAAPVDRRWRASGARRRTAVRLAYTAIHPFVRIAHRQAGPLRIAPRIIFDHELVYIVEGRATVEFQGRTPMGLSPGDLLFIRPFEPHAFTDGPGDRRCTHVAVHFDFAPGAPAGHRPYDVRLSDGLSIPRLAHFPVGGTVGRTLGTLLAAHASPAAPGALLASALLTQVIAVLLDPRRRTPGPEFARGASSPDRRRLLRVDRVVHHVHQHLGDPLTAGHLARVADLSVPHLTRLFRETMGYTPMAFVRRARVDAAKRLLADVDLSVKQVARKVGFDDPYHFSRVFSQLDGLPPTAYRDAALPT